MQQMEEDRRQLIHKIRKERKNKPASTTPKSKVNKVESKRNTVDAFRLEVPHVSQISAMVSRSPMLGPIKGRLNLQNQLLLENKLKTP
jgi:hypothetical protein